MPPDAAQSFITESTEKSPYTVQELEGWKRKCEEAQTQVDDLLGKRLKVKSEWQPLIQSKQNLQREIREAELNELRLVVKK